MKHYSIGSAIGRRCMFVERYFRLFCRLWIVVFGAVSFARCTQICSGCCVLLRDRTTPLETTRLLNYEAIDVIAASMFDGTMKKNNALAHHFFQHRRSQRRKAVAVIWGEFGREGMYPLGKTDMLQIQPRNRMKQGCVRCEIVKGC